MSCLYVTVGFAMPNVCFTSSLLEWILQTWVVVQARELIFTTLQRFKVNLLVRYYGQLAPWDQRGKSRREIDNFDHTSF